MTYDDRSFLFRLFALLALLILVLIAMISYLSDGVGALDQCEDDISNDITQTEFYQDWVARNTKGER